MMEIMKRKIAQVKCVPPTETTTIITTDAAIVGSVTVAAIITMSRNPRKK